MVDQSKLAAQTEAVFKSSRNEVDPVSGNEVPTGSLPEEVRDDIPAQLSEGEYVVPADVVRYYGVKFFEDLRGEAKMGWQAMDRNGRIGGEPMSPPGMEMGDDELPFDISELNFVEVPDDAIAGMAEGGFFATLKKAFGQDKRPSTKEIMERRAKEREALDKFAKGDKSSSSSKSSWGDASGNKPYQDMTQSMRDTFAVKKGPGMMETLSGFVPEMPNIWGSENDFTAREREAAKTRKGTNLLKGYAYGGYSLSEGDPGYEEQGALGFGKEGLSLSGGVVMRLYRNDAGDELEIPFLNGEPQVEIPEGYYPVNAAESVIPSEDTTAPSSGDGGDGGGIAPAQPQSINFKELSTAELQKMVADQQSYKPDAIAAVLGALNPLLGIGLRLAMWDQSRRVEAELERRAGLPDLSVEEKTAIQETLKVAKQEKPTLMRKIFGKVKDSVLDVVDPQERVETSQGAPTRAIRNPLTGSAKEPTSAGVPEPSPITVEELPPAGLEGVADAIESSSRFEIKNEDGPVVYYNGKPVMRFPTEQDAQDYIDRNQGMLPAGITYDDLLMGKESPVTKTFDLTDAINGAAGKIGDIRNTVLKAGFEIGKAYKPESIVKRPTTPAPEDYGRKESTRINRETTKEIAKAQRDLATPEEIQAIKDSAAKKKQIIANRVEGARLGYSNGGMTYVPEVYDFLDKYDPNTASDDDKEFASLIARDAVANSIESQGWGKSHEAIKEQSRRSKEATMAVQKASGSKGFFDRGTNPNWRDDSK